jgi:hypothetical protein
MQNCGKPKGLLTLWGPTVRGAGFLRSHPALETPGDFQRSLWDRSRWVSECFRRLERSQSCLELSRRWESTERDQAITIARRSSFVLPEP